MDGALAADDVLNLDGVVLFSNANGVHLGDDRFEPLLTQVGRRFERNSSMIWCLNLLVFDLWQLLPGPAVHRSAAMRQLSEENPTFGCRAEYAALDPHQTRGPSES